MIISIFRKKISKINIQSNFNLMDYFLKLKVIFILIVVLSGFNLYANEHNKICVTYLEANEIDKSHCTHQFDNLKVCSTVTCNVKFQTWNGSEYKDRTYPVKIDKCENKSRFQVLTTGVTLPLTLNLTSDAYDEALSEANNFLNFLRSRACQ